MIKQKMLIFSWVTLGSVLVLMVIGSLFVKAQAIPASDAALSDYVNNFCFDGKIGTHELDSTDLAKLYTNSMNDYFDARVLLLMTDLTTPYPTPNLEDYGVNGMKLCGDDSSSNKVDMTCRAISICYDAKNQINPSPYCVGVMALGITPQRYAQYKDKYPEFASNVGKIPSLKSGYFCYKAAMEGFKEDYLDGTALGILRKCDTSQVFYNKTELCKTKADWEKETDPAKKAVLESKIKVQFETDGSAGSVAIDFAKNLAFGLAGTIPIFGPDSATISAQKKAGFVANELERAKQALDQTLEAYSQMRTAWSMHIKYVDTFNTLVKYRDAIVKIRKKTDAFPNKFIDATSTHCL